jgi:ketosteroid isomerase-like protein
MPPFEDEVLAANRAFYDAFARRDVEGIEALWSESPAVACIHPGWDALRGREEVMASWRAILDNPSAPEIICTDATAHVFGDLAFVICSESVEGAALIATNTFAREGGDWKLVHHHAGPVSRGEEPVSRRSEPPRILN